MRRKAQGGFAVNTQTRAGSASWYVPQKRGRGRPRIIIDADKIASLYQQGQTYQQIADLCGVCALTVSNRVRELIQEGRIEPRKSPRDRWYADLREKRARTTENIIIMYNQMATYKQIGKTLGVTRERVRQHIKRATAETGQIIFQVRENFIGLAEARSRLSVRVPLASLKKAFANGEIHGIQNIYTRKMYIDCRNWEMVERWAQNTQSKQCMVCGKVFTITSKLNCRRILCSSECTVIRREQTRQKRNPYQFRGWHKKVAIKLADYHITDQEDWLGAFEAMRHTGLTYIKLRYLAKCGIIATHDHPSKQRCGKPTLTFSRGQLDVVKEVLLAINNNSQK